MIADGKDRGEGRVDHDDNDGDSDDYIYHIITSSSSYYYLGEIQLTLHWRSNPGRQVVMILHLMLMMMIYVNDDDLC